MQGGWPRLSALSDCTDPELSAASGLWAWQRRALALSLVLLGVGMALAPEATLIGLLAIMAMPFLCVVVLRTVALWQLAHPLPKPTAPAAATPGPLPVYTVLVPLFREAGVVGDLLGSLRALDYPADRLEIMLVVEAVDGETRAALACARLDPHMQVLVVPEGDPRTKPRAIQYALAVCARRVCRRLRCRGRARARPAAPRAGER